jgi:hypothetical protein
MFSSRNFALYGSFPRSRATPLLVLVYCAGSATIRTRYSPAGAPIRVSGDPRVNVPSGFSFPSTDIIAPSVPINSTPPTVRGLLSGSRTCPFTG